MEITYELADDQEGIEEPVTSAVGKFEVVVKNSHNFTYHPGQFVMGHVLVDVKRAYVTRGILLQFCGRGGVYWTEKHRGAEGKCIGTVPYSAQEEFFNLRHYVYDPGLIPAGVHKFPFKYPLTPPLPDNYQDNLCQIEYFLEARLKQDTNTRNDLKHRQDILIVTPVDLNKVILPDVTLPVHVQTTMTLGRACCVSPPIVGFLRLVRSGYAPGETIHVQADLENNSNSMMTAKFTLYEERGYKTPGKMHKHRDIMYQVTKGPVKKYETKHWKNIPLLVPRKQVFNVESSKIFGIRHTVEMEVIPKGSSKRLTLPLHVVLGSLPLDSVTIETQTHSRLQPNKREQENRETVEEIEHQNKLDALSQDSGFLNQNEHFSRQRRKDRNKKIYPEDRIDTEDYPEQMKGKQ